MAERLTSYDVYPVPVAEVLFDADFNCRSTFSPQSVEALAESIRQNGLQFPIVVQPWTGEFKYRLVAGHRRFAAVTTFLGWDTIPAMTRDLTDHQAKVLNFTENLERKDLNLLEEAKALQRLYPDGVSLRQAAEELKRPTRWIHARLRLLALPEEVQQMAASGMLMAANVEILATLDSPSEQLLAARQIIKARSDRGKTSSLMEAVDKRYLSKFVHRRSKSELSQMVSRLLEPAFDPLCPRLLAWAAGYLTREELEHDIDDARRRGETRLRHSQTAQGHAAEARNRRRRL